MRKPIPVIHFARFADFRGGLNLRDDAFALQPNELADCLNVRIMPQGGVRQRKTLSARNSSFSTALRNIGSFYGNGVTQIVVQDGNDAGYSTDAVTFTAINPDALTLNGIMRMATMSRLTVATSERLYLQRNAEQVAWKWSGSAATVLADANGAYNDNIAAPAGGKMPIAKYVCTHGGFMFHANTVEATVVKANRVRWSHPGEPEDYRTNDYVDVGVDDGDVITGLASFGGVLYIFKNRSVWKFTGLDPNTFALTRLYTNFGAVEQEAICVTPQGIYFFDAVHGVYLLDAAGKLTWMWAKLATDLLSGSAPTIPVAQTSKTIVSWADSRVWVTVPYGVSATTPTRHFIHDPQCQPASWYVYYYSKLNVADQTFGPMVEFRPPLGVTKILQIGPTAVYQLDVDEGSKDYWTASSGTQSLFNSSFRTSWFSGGVPGVKKRFKRPTLIVGDAVSTTLAVAVYKDYQTQIPKSTRNVVVTALSTGNGVWGTSTWGSFVWGSPAQDDQQIVRSSNMGNLYAVQVDISTPPGSFFSLNAIELHYLLRRF